MPLLLALIVIGLLAFWFWRGLGASKTEGPNNNLTKELLRLCRGNVDLAERLLQYELDANPAVSRNRALKLAIERLRRDQ